MNGDPFQGLRVDSCLTWGDELSKETHSWKSNGLHWAGAQGRRAAGKRTQKTRSATGSKAWAFWWWDSFPRFLWPVILTLGPSWWRRRCSAKSRILRGGGTCGISIWLFLNFSSCWWLVSSVLLTKISRRKMTHTDGTVVPGQGRWWQSGCFPWLLSNKWNQNVIHFLTRQKFLSFLRYTYYIIHTIYIYIYIYIYICKYTHIHKFFDYIW